MGKFINIKLIKGSFETDSDFSKFDYNTVLKAATVGNTGADVLVSVLEAAGAVIELSGNDITGQEDKPLFYFSKGGLPSPLKAEYEVVNG